MPNVSSFGAQTENAVVQGTVTDRQMVIPEVPPQGLMSVGPRQTYNFIKEPWNAQTSYVFYDAVKDGKGSTYIATKPVVPAGTPLTDEDYWFKSSDPNAQLNELQEIVKLYDGRISQNASAITEEVARAKAAEQAEEQRATAAEATKAPVNHATQETIYGVGNEVNYGHVKLAADDTPLTSGANDGIAATPKMIASELARTSPIFFTATTNEAYIGVPEKTSFAKGVARFNAPGIYIIQSDIFIPSLTSNSKTIKGLQYYVTHTYTEQPKEANNIFYDIIEWNTTYRENVHISATFIFNCTAQMFKKAGNNYIDLLIDLFSYELTDGDPNIPVTVTFNVVKLKEFEKSA